MMNSLSKSSINALAILAVAVTAAGAKPATPAVRSSQAAATSKSAATPVQQLMGSNLVDYYVKDADITISYPRGWKVLEHPDKDKLVKLQDDADGSTVTCEISAAEMSGASLDTFCKLVEETFLAKLPSYKKIEERKIAVGKGGKITGICKDITFTMGPINLKQRILTFPYANKFITIVLGGMTEDFVKRNAVCNQILVSATEGARGRSAASTGTSGTTTQSSASSQTTTQRAWEFTRCSSSKTPVTFSYPKNWQMEDVDDPDHPLKIVGKEPDGVFAEISLYQGDMHPYLNTEQMLQMLEDKYYAGHKNYRKANQTSVNFGTNSGLQGVTQEMSFDMNGTKISQRIVSFPVKDRIYTLSIVSPNMKDSQMQSLFSKILATINVNN